MAALLYRLGRLAFQRRWVFALIWAAVLAGVGVAALRAPAAPPDNSSVPGTESQQANDLLQKSFPNSRPDGAIAQIVFVAPHGQKLTTARDKAIIGKVVDEAAATPQAASAVNPFTGHEMSKDGSAAIATISYTVAANNLTSATTNALQNAVRQGRDAGLTVQIGGTALSSPVSGTSLVVGGVAIAAVVLLLTFGSLVAAGLPLLTAGTGVGLSVAAIIALGSTLGLSSTTRTLALMLGLAVGIDYALLIVSRYREERARDQAPQEAAARAVGTAGTAVAFAGLTVIIALAGLSLVGMGMIGYTLPEIRRLLISLVQACLPDPKGGAIRLTRPSTGSATSSRWSSAAMAPIRGSAAGYRSSSARQGWTMSRWRPGCRCTRWATPGGPSDLISCAAFGHTCWRRARPAQPNSMSWMRRPALILRIPIRS